MDSNVQNIGRRSWCGELLFIFVITLMLFPRAYANSGKQRYKDQNFNITMETYNFTTTINYGKSGWGMRLFGRLLTPTPIVDRSLSNMLYIIFDCGKCNPDVKDFETKEYDSGSWNTVPRDNWSKDPEYFGGGYFIKRLKPDTKYVVRATLSSVQTVAAFGSTCNRKVGPVADLRAEKVAACWIDVRFKDPDEDCDGKYYFKFEYSNTDSLMEKDKKFRNDITRFGMYFQNDTTGPRWQWTNLHPCPTYPDENCLFLGEHVRPRATHLIYVRAIRFGSSTWEERGEEKRLVVRSNLDYDAYPPSFCPPVKEVVEMWVVILMITLVIMTIVAIIVLAELLRRQKIKKKALDSGESKKMKAARKDKKKKEREERKKKLKK